MLESIQIYQGIFGRMLNYGTILVHGVGASRQSVMWIESPLEFRQHIFKELNNNQSKYNQQIKYYGSNSMSPLWATRQ